MHIALTLLMTYVGVPCIYYGDEVGLEGGLDPDNRRCLPWHSTENMQWLDSYQRWIAIRKQFSSLQSGSLQWLHCGEGILAYARQLGDEAVVVAINMQVDDTSIELPLWQLGLDGKHLNDLLEPSKAIEYADQLAVFVEGRSCKVWRIE